MVKGQGYIKRSSNNIIIVMNKICNTCSQTKPISSFYKNGDRTKLRWKDCERDVRREHRHEYNQREDTKQINNERRKRFYRNHQEEILNKCKEKFKCDCGSEVTKNVKSRHERSIKHQQFLNQS